VWYFFIVACPTKAGAPESVKSSRGFLFSKTSRGVRSSSPLHLWRGAGGEGTLLNFSSRYPLQIRRRARLLAPPLAEEAGRGLHRVFHSYRAAFKQKNKYLA